MTEHLDGLAQPLHVGPGAAGDATAEAAAPPDDRDLAHDEVVADFDLDEDTAHPTLHPGAAAAFDVGKDLGV
jgi:hypothetical protein